MKEKPKKITGYYEVTSVSTKYYIYVNNKTYEVEKNIYDAWMLVFNVIRGKKSVD